jgi:hypothetical protein
LIIGDKKGPVSYDPVGAELCAVEQQLRLPYKLARLLTFGHYARKNLGYLIAFERGATSIYETDDDNAPLSNWNWRNERTRARRVTQTGWVNVYRSFSDEHIWPRGLPLDLCHADAKPVAVTGADEDVGSPIQQGLANGSPDVDAVWRLLMDKVITFRDAPSLFLPKGAWCPFNSQSTWWFPAAYPLMYLPTFCSFRMTDIWRSFIAQRCLWEMGTGVTFHAAEVVQDRNIHDFMRDFADEVPGYLKNKEIVRCLDTISLKSGREAVSSNLLACYELLVAHGVFPEKELELLRAWVEDVRRVTAA